MHISMESALEWIRIISSSERINFLCSFLRLIVPLELRFIASYIEDLARLNFNELRSLEIMANQVSEYDNIQSLQLNQKLDRINISLCLLHSQNSICAGKIFNLLKDIASQYVNNNMPYEDFELVFLLSCHHPAFMYKHRIQLFTYLQNIQAYISQKKIKFTSSNTVISEVKENIPVQVSIYNSVSCQTIEEYNPYLGNINPSTLLQTKLHKSLTVPQISDKNNCFEHNDFNYFFKSVINQINNIDTLDKQLVIGSESQKFSYMQEINSFNYKFPNSSFSGVSIQSADNLVQFSDFPMSIDQIAVNNLYNIPCQNEINPNVEDIMPELNFQNPLTSQLSYIDANLIDSVCVNNCKYSDTTITSHANVIELPVIKSSYMLSDFGYNQSLIAKNNVHLINGKNSEVTSVNFSCLKAQHTFSDNLIVSCDSNKFCDIKLCNVASIGESCKYSDCDASSTQIIDSLDLNICYKSIDENLSGNMLLNSNLFKGLDNKIDEITLAYVSFPNLTNLSTDMNYLYNIDSTNGNNLIENMALDNKSKFLNSSSQTYVIDSEMSMTNMPDLISSNKIITTIIDDLTEKTNDLIATNAHTEEYITRNSAKMHQLNEKILQSIELNNRSCIDSLDTHMLTQANIVLDSYVNSAGTLKDSFKIYTKSEDKITSCYNGKVISSFDNKNSSYHQGNCIQMKYDTQSVINNQNKNCDSNNSKIQVFDNDNNEDKNDKVDLKLSNFCSECPNLFNSTNIESHNNLGDSRLINSEYNESAYINPTFLANNSQSHNNYMPEKFICPSCNTRFSNLVNLSELNPSVSIEGKLETKLCISQEELNSNFNSINNCILNNNVVAIKEADENVILMCDQCCNIFCNIKYNVNSISESKDSEINKKAVECATIFSSPIIVNKSAFSGSRDIFDIETDGNSAVCSLTNITINESINNNILYDNSNNNEYSLIYTSSNYNHNEKLVIVKESTMKLDESSNLTVTGDKLFGVLEDNECNENKLVMKDFDGRTIINNNFDNNGTDLLSNCIHSADTIICNEIENSEAPLLINNQKNIEAVNQKYELLHTTEQDIKENWDSIFKSLPTEEVDKVLKLINNLSISRFNSDPNSSIQKSNNIQRQINETILKFKNNYLASQKNICHKKESVELNKVEFPKSNINLNFLNEIKNHDRLKLNRSSKSGHCKNLNKFQKSMESKINTFKISKHESININSINNKQFWSKESPSKKKSKIDVQKKQITAIKISDNTNKSSSLSTKTSSVNKLVYKNQNIRMDKSVSLDKDSLSNNNDIILSDLHDINKSGSNNQIDLNNKCLNANNHNSNYNFDNINLNKDLQFPNSISDNVGIMNMENLTKFNENSNNINLNENIQDDIEKLNKTSCNNETNCIINKSNNVSNLNTYLDKNEIDFEVNTSFLVIQNINAEQQLRNNELMVESNKCQSIEEKTESYNISESVPMDLTLLDTNDNTKCKNINVDINNQKIHIFHLNNPDSNSMSISNNLKFLQTDELSKKIHESSNLDSLGDSHNIDLFNDEHDIEKLLTQEDTTTHLTQSATEIELLNKDNALYNVVSDNSECDRPIILGNEGEDKVVWKINYTKNRNINSEMSNLINPLEQKVGRPLLGRRWNKDNIERVDNRLPAESVFCEPPIRNYDRSSSFTNLSDCESTSNISTDSKHSDKRDSISDVVIQDVAVLKSSISQDNLSLNSCSLPVMQLPQRQIYPGYYQTPHSRPIFRYSYSDMNRMRNSNQLRYRGGDRNYRNAHVNSPPLFQEGGKNFRFVDIGFPRSVPGFYPINNNFQSNVNNFLGAFPSGNNFQSGLNNNFHSGNNNFYTANNISANNGSNFISNFQGNSNMRLSYSVPNLHMFPIGGRPPYPVEFIEERQSIIGSKQDRENGTNCIDNAIDGEGSNPTSMYQIGMQGYRITYPQNPHRIPPPRVYPPFCGIMLSPSQTESFRPPMYLLRQFPPPQIRPTTAFVQFCGNCGQSGHTLSTCVDSEFKNNYKNAAEFSLRWSPKMEEKD